MAYIFDGGKLIGLDSCQFSLQLINTWDLLSVLQRRNQKDDTIG